MTESGHRLYVSIADCPLCARIPHKVSQDTEGEHDLIPPEVDQLITIVEMDDEDTPAYCTSTTRLLRCPTCGTYYYYNHYDDDGQHFMDPTCDDVTVRRYDPATALAFLQRIAAGPANALPKTMGQMKTAFAEGSGAPSTSIAAAGLDETQRIARAEMDRLTARMDTIMADLVQTLQRPGLDGQIKTYAAESLCNYHLARCDWDALSAALLHHPDPVVRALAARLVIGVATGDAPVIDLVHTDASIRGFLEKVITDKARLDELVSVLLDVSVNAGGTLPQYDHGYGKSNWYEGSLQSYAMYGLVVAAGQGADLSAAIPRLLALLPDERLSRDVCWILRQAASRRKATRQITDELARADPSRAKKLAADPELKTVLAICNKTRGRTDVATPA